MNISKIIRNILKAPFVILVCAPIVLILFAGVAIGVENVSWKVDKILPAFER